MPSRCSPTAANISSNVDEAVGSVESIFVESFSCTDQQKMWRALMQPDQHPVIEIEFAQFTRIAMIRLWNYSESRVHAQMGVRQLKLELDDETIFDDEIDCAFADTETAPMGEFALGLTPDRPVTREVSRAVEEKQRPISASTTDKTEEDCVGKVKIVHLELVENWGAPNLIGLNGLELLGHRQDTIDPTSFTITANGSSDPQRLVNGKNLTRQPDDVWLSSFDSTTPTTITINFSKPSVLTGISFWNYNVSPEMSYTGVRLLHIFINGRLVASNVLLRKAPGFVLFDFVQDFILDRLPSFRPLIRPTTRSIYGFIFQIQLLSSWGDEFYIGLNGIELFNRRNELIKVGPHNLAAFPESVNILPSVQGDPRVSLNLINGYNDTDRAEQMWLTPILPNRFARVSVDDLIVYSGDVPASTADKTGVLEIGFQG
ncbi:unnamed protein product [Nippostrongylus brasiliensis]|uniref:DUF4457 domain-containing protein n=1 Tax=Nippostrongylus brasiliensis TaxID=27835 RepID=A0A158QXL4_NIPBR|nr:unnamed protein product [Nippostrongylus brasiliensis]